MKKRKPRPKRPYRALLLPLALGGLLTFPAGCHTMDPYRPGGPRQGPTGAADPRPDLPGKPVVEGHPLYWAEQFLRARFPAVHKVTIRSSPLQGNLLGVTRYDCPGWLAGMKSEDGSLVIEIRDDLEGWLQREVLCHEYAHVLAWDAPEGVHDSVWAAYFGLIYRTVRGE